MSMRLMAWVAQSFGRPVTRVLLPPICFYFLVSSGGARRAIQRFRERALGRPVTWCELYRHYHVFAATILDRVYFLNARFELFDVKLVGLDVLERELAKGQGCILLGSHLGSFEVVRALGLFRRNLEVRVLMDQENAPLVRRMTRELNPTVADTVIQIGGVGTMLQVKECLDRGGVLGVMGDRVTQTDHTVTCQFFGHAAQFPTGPIRLAHAVGTPVVMFVGRYCGGNQYEVHLELFSERVQLTSDQRESDVRQWVQRYAERLEGHCRHAPDNWFNFYEFWDA